MKNTTNPSPNERTYYNAVQLSLPLNVGVCIDEDDPVYSFIEAVKEVNLSKYVKPISSNNTNSHDRGMLLKVLLFAFMDNQRSLSTIEKLCKTDIRYMYLSNEERPSKAAFSRLTSLLTDSIEEVFYDISRHIAVDLMKIDINTGYVDGTKIEANANKNTFVYRKRITNQIPKLNEKIREETRSLNREFGYSYPVKDEYASPEVFYICQYLMEQMTALDIQIQYGKGKDPKFRKKIFNIENWKKNEEGYRICPDGRVFDVYIKDVYDQPGKSLQIRQLYREANKCEGVSISK